MEVITEHIQQWRGWIRINGMCTAIDSESYRSHLALRALANSIMAQ